MAGGTVLLVQVVGGDPQGLPSFHLWKGITVRLLILLRGGWLQVIEAMLRDLEPICE